MGSLCYQFVCYVCFCYNAVCNNLHDLHRWHISESVTANSVLSIPGCKLFFHHLRAVNAYNRPKKGAARLKPSWEQRISWWSSTIKRLLYVNRANPLWKRRVMPVWFHAQSTHWKWFSGQQTPCLNSYGGKSFAKSQPPTQNHCSCKTFCCCSLHFKVSFGSCSVVNVYDWLLIQLQNSVKQLNGLKHCKTHCHLQNAAYLV